MVKNAAGTTLLSTFRFGEEHGAAKGTGPGAGGYATGIDAGPGGRFIMRTDTFNAVVWEPAQNQWVRQLRPGDNIAASQLDLFYGASAHPWGQCGTYAAAISKSDGLVRALVCMGYVWVTTTGGVGTNSYTRTALAQQLGCEPNESARTSGDKPLAIHPTNSSHMIFGSPSTGVKVTTDRFSTHTAIPTGTIPLPPAGQRYSVAYNPADPTNMFVYVPGSGLYESTNSGVAWARDVNAPTGKGTLTVGPTGIVYLAGTPEQLGDSTIYRRNGTTWTDTGRFAHSVVVSTQNSTHVYAIMAGGGLDASTNSGVAWSAGTNKAAVPVRQATNIGWQQYTREDFMSMGGMAFSATANEIWIAQGIGSWKIVTPPTTITENQPYTIIENSLGLESMVTSSLTLSPVQDILGAPCHDRGCHIVPKREAGRSFPATHGGTIRFQHGVMADHSPDNEQLWYHSITQERVIGVNGVDDPLGTHHEYAWTTDAGKTYAASRKYAEWKGSYADLGPLQALGDDCIVVCENGFGKRPVVIFNPRSASPTFNQLTLGDNAALDIQPVFNRHRRVFIRDRYSPANARVCYIYNPGTGNGNASDLACRGIWKLVVNTLTSSVTSFTRVFNGTIIGFNQDYYHGKFTQVGPDDFLWCGGDEATGLYRSTNGMAAWANMTGNTDDQGAGNQFAEVFAAAAGAPRDVGGPQTLYAVGYRGTSGYSATNTDVSKFAYWASHNNGALWERIAQFPNGIFDMPCDWVASLNEYGFGYIGYGGCGWIRHSVTSPILMV